MASLNDAENVIARIRIRPRGQHKRVAHLPLYDTCPHRQMLLDTTACGCLTFACKLHGTCSTQPRTGLKLCQQCEDFPK